MLAGHRVPEGALCAARPGRGWPARSGRRCASRHPRGLQAPAAHLSGALDDAREDHVWSAERPAPRLRCETASGAGGGGGDEEAHRQGADVTQELRPRVVRVCVMADALRRRRDAAPCCEGAPGGCKRPCSAGAHALLPGPLGARSPRQAVARFHRGSQRSSCCWGALRAHSAWTTGLWARAQRTRTRTRAPRLLSLMPSSPPSPRAGAMELPHCAPS